MPFLLCPVKLCPMNLCPVKRFLMNLCSMRRCPFKRRWDGVPSTCETASDETLISRESAELHCTAQKPMLLGNFFCFFLFIFYRDFLLGALGACEFDKPLRKFRNARVALGWYLQIKGRAVSDFLLPRVGATRYSPLCWLSRAVFWQRILGLSQLIVGRI